MQVKEFAAADLPVNTVAPSVTGTGYQGEPLTCNHGTWNAAAGSTRWVTWYRANKIPASHPHFRAPTQLDYNNTTTPAEAEHGTVRADVAGLADRRHRRHLHADRPDLGKTIYCQVSVDNAGATVFKTALAPEIIVGHATLPVGGYRPGDALADAGRAGHVRRVHPGRRERLHRHHARPTSSPPPATRRCRCPSPGT